jgi:hypothetical protein
MSPYLRCFAYPFTKANLPVMLIGIAVFVGIPLVLSRVPFSGVLVVIVQLFLVAYYAVFLQSILGASMMGREEFPAWPEHSDPQDLMADILSLAGPYVVSFLPLLVLRCCYANFGAFGERAWGYLTFFLSGPTPYSLPDVPSWFGPVSWALAGLGLLYLPMALLVWSFYGGRSILNPFAVVRSACRTGPSYLLLVGLIAGLCAAGWGIGAVTARFRTDFLESLASALILFYALAVALRLVGVHYHVNRGKLDWERVEPEPVG